MARGDAVVDIVDVVIAEDEAEAAVEVLYMVHKRLGLKMMTAITMLSSGLRLEGTV